jgi:hypothetical protein
MMETWGWAGVFLETHERVVVLVWVKSSIGECTSRECTLDDACPGSNNEDRCSKGLILSIYIPELLRCLECELVCSMLWILLTISCRCWVSLAVVNGIYFLLAYCCRCIKYTEDGYSCY